MFIGRKGEHKVEGWQSILTENSVLKDFLKTHIPIKLVI